jgi:hypothetical protein
MLNHLDGKNLFPFWFKIFYFCYGIVNTWMLQITSLKVSKCEKWIFFELRNPEYKWRPQSLQTTFFIHPSVQDHRLHCIPKIFQIEWDYQNFQISRQYLRTNSRSIPTNPKEIKSAQFSPFWMRPSLKSFYLQNCKDERPICSFASFRACSGSRFPFRSDGFKSNRTKFDSEFGFQPPLPNRVH